MCLDKSTVLIFSTASSYIGRAMTKIFTDRVSGEGSAIGRVRPPVHLFPLPRFSQDL